MIDYIEQKTVVRVPVKVTLMDGTRMDSTHEGRVMYARPEGNTWYTCEGAVNRGLITIQKLGATSLARRGSFGLV